MNKSAMKSEKLQEQQKESRIFSTIFYYTGLIILGPVSIFFGTKILFFNGLLGISSVASNVWSAVAAVVALHILLGMYIYKAYSEPGKTKPDKMD